MKIQILSSNRQIYQGEGESITLPAEKGQIQILENHAPLFALLKRGDISIEGNKKITILSGAVEVLNNEVMVLVKEL